MGRPAGVKNKASGKVKAVKPVVVVASVDLKGRTERLPASDVRILHLLSDAQRERLARNPAYTLEVEFTPMRGPRGGTPHLAPTRIIEVEQGVDKPLRDFKLAVDEDEFMRACRMESEDSKWGRLHLALMRPNVTFMQAVKSEGISLLELNQFWSDSSKHMGTIRMMNHLPDVMEQTAVEARQKVVVCARCAGTQVVYEYEKPVVELEGGRLDFGEKVLVRKACPTCVDSIVPGRVIQPGDLESKKLMFKVAGLLKDGQVVNVDARTLNVGAVEGEVSAIGRILERKPTQIPSVVAPSEGEHADG